MSIWSDPLVTSEVVRRYLAGEGCTEIAKTFDLTRNQVLSKMVRMGHVRRQASDPGVHYAKGAGRPRGRGEPRSGAVASEAMSVRVLRTLERGPLTSVDLAEMLGSTRQTVGKVISGLVAQGRAERLGRLPGDRGFQYALRPDGGFAPVRRGQDAQAVEDRYVSARKAGGRAGDLATSLKLSPTAANDYEKSYRFQTTGGFSQDNSCPKFAYDDRHLEALARHRRFPVLPRLADLRRSA